MGGAWRSKDGSGRWASGLVGLLKRLSVTLLIAAAWAAPGAAPAMAAGWSPATVVDNTFGSAAVSCASASFCVAVDDGVAGDAVSYNGTSWSAPFSIDPNPNQGASSVSCASTLFCAAVDAQGNVVTYDGSSWSAPTKVDSGALNLQSVSCPSANFCAAVGVDIMDGSGDLVTYDGSSWSAPTSVDASGLASVTCPSASFCAAVDGSGDVLTYDGKSWSTPNNVDPGHGVSSLSCPSAFFCAAVDGYGDVLTYDGSGWSTPTYVDEGLGSVSCASASFCAAVDGSGDVVTYDGSSWSAPKSVDPGGYLGAASCPSANFCAAIDSAGRVVTYDGNGWSAPSSVDPNGQGLQSVSCPSASFCVAVDGSGNALTYDGASWSAPVGIDSGGGGLKSVSCPSASFCAAVDGSGDVVTYNGTSWSAPVDPGEDVTSVSCASASFCAAVDGSGDAVTYDGSTWSAPTSVDPGGYLLSVSCPSASFCAAVDGSGDAYTYDGSSWSAPTSLGTHVGSVSCPSASFCAAVGADAVTYDGSSWSAPTSVDPVYGLNSVSCPSASFCAAGDFYGNLFTYDGSSWSAPTNAGLFSPSFSLSVSCGSASFCAAVDQAGRASVYSGPGQPALETLSVSLAGSGSGSVTSSPAGISCPGSCSAQFDQGTQVTLTAEPAAGSSFTGWSGSGCSGTGACRVTMSDSAAVTATFAPSHVALAQGQPTSATVAYGAGYKGQLSVVNAGGAVTYVEGGSAHSGEVVVSSTGAISASSTLAGGTYTVSGTDSDTRGDAGVWGFTLTVVPPPPPAFVCTDYGVALVPAGYVVTSLFEDPGCGRPQVIEGDLAYNAVTIARPRDGLTMCTEVSGNWRWPNWNEYVVTSVEYTPACGPFFNGSPIPMLGQYDAVTIALPRGGLTMCAVSGQLRVPSGYDATAELSTEACGPVESFDWNAATIWPENSIPALDSLSTIGTRGGVVTIIVSCPPPASGCSGTLGMQGPTGSTASDAASAARSALPWLAEAKFRMPAGSGFVRLRLNARGRRLLAGAKTLRARAILTIRPDGGASRTTVHTVTIHAGGLDSAQLKARIRGEITPRGKGAKINALLSNHGYLLRFTSPIAGRVVIDWYRLSAATAGTDTGTLIATGARSFGRAGAADIRMVLTAGGKRVLGGARRLQLTAAVKFVPAGEYPVTLTRTFTLTR